MRKLAVVLALAAAQTVATPLRADDPFSQWIQRYKREAARAPSQTRVTASGALVSGEPALHFSVTNTSSAPLTFFTASLPWGNAYSINVLGLTSKGALRPVYLIDDPGPGRVVLPPAGTLEGNYILHYALERPREALKASDLIVVWSYGAAKGVVVFQKQ